MPGGGFLYFSNRHRGPSERTAGIKRFLAFKDSPSGCAQFPSWCGTGAGNGMNVTVDAQPGGDGDVCPSRKAASVTGFNPPLAVME